MANKRSFCFIIAFHTFVTLENRLTSQCPSSWPVVITMKKKLAGTWKTNFKKRILAGPNEWQQVCNWSNLNKVVEVVKGRILAGWAQKSPKPCSGGCLGLVIYKDLKHSGSGKTLAAPFWSLPPTWDIYVAISLNGHNKGELKSIFDSRSSKLHYEPMSPRRSSCVIYGRCRKKKLPDVGQFYRDTCQLPKAHNLVVFGLTLWSGRTGS
jgi:hypothetical protein